MGVHTPKSKALSDSMYDEGLVEVDARVSGGVAYPGASGLTSDPIRIRLAIAQANAISDFINHDILPSVNESSASLVFGDLTVEVSDEEITITREA